MKVVKFSQETDEVLILYTIDEFNKEISRCAIFMNLYRTFTKEDEVDKLQLSLFPEKTHQSLSEEDAKELERIAFAKEEEELAEKIEKEKQQLKEEHLRLYKELRKQKANVNPFIIFKKNEVKRHAHLIVSTFGKNLVNTDSEEFDSFLVKRDIRRKKAVYILTTWASLGLCEIYKSGRTIKTFKLKF